MIIFFWQNTIIPDPKGVGMQGVALRLNGDRSVLYRVRILGSQDTLLDDAGSHYFYQCYIQGSVDFICGNARSLYKVLTAYLSTNVCSDSPIMLLCLCEICITLTRVIDPLSFSLLPFF